jgi:hypothetical protein
MKHIFLYTCQHLLFMYLKSEDFLDLLNPLRNATSSRCLCVNVNHAHIP